MSYVETAIKEAGANGWSNLEHGCFCGNKEAPCSYDRVFCDYKAFLDPLFWQSLGKARGWDDDTEIVQDPEEQWQELWKYHWHRFIDHLAGGDDAESFFATLLGPTKEE